MSIGPLLGYIFMTTLPISFISGGNKLALAGLQLYEIALIFIVAYSIFMIAIKAKHFKFIPLDFIAVAYVFFTLLPLVLSLDNLYVAARDYRHLFMVPLIAYLTLPIVFEDFYQIPYAFLIIIPVLLIGTISLIPEFFRSGVRPKVNELITLGLLSSWSVALCFSVRNIIFFSTKFKFLRYITAFFMLLVMAISVSRALFFGLFFSLLLASFMFKKKIYQKIFILSFIGFLLIFYCSLLVVNESSLKPKIELSNEYKEMRRSVHRLTSSVYYIDSIKNRMYLWKKAFQAGLEEPILGKGAYAYRGFKKIGRATPHNIFISTFLTSGIVGTLLFTILIIVSYTTVFSSAKVNRHLLFCKFLFIALTILLVIGATNDFSGGRYLLFFILLSAIAATKKYSINIE